MKKYIAIQISLTFVPDGPIDNKSALVQVMAWRRIADKLSTELMPSQFADAYMQEISSRTQQSGKSES